MVDWSAAMDDLRARIRADHRCACPHCDPSLTVDSTSRGMQHVVVRIWDDPSEEAARERAGEIILDGQRVDGAFEAILGEQGTVWTYRKTPDGLHRCLRCTDEIEKRIGMDGCDGLTQDGIVRVSKGNDGMIVHTAINLCTIKQTGAVELRAKRLEEQGQ